MSDLRRFRNELPFGDDTLRRIRTDVMARIEREPRREPRWLGMVLRSSFAALALILFVVWQAGESSRTHVVESPSRPVVEPARPPVSIASTPSETRRLEDQETRRVHRAARRRTHIVRSNPTPASAEPAAVRIELHTNNPDIRILWINQPTGETR